LLLACTERQEEGYKASLDCQEEKGHGLGICRRDLRKWVGNLLGGEGRLKLHAGCGMKKQIVELFLLGLAFSSALGVAILGQATSGSHSPPPPIGKLVDVGGYRVHLYCTGAGSPAVVIVGAGYSFDWGLVQSGVEKFTQVCAYDHSGIGWSDDAPKDSCGVRVSEVHAALKSAGIKGPYVLVGHSLGGLVARVYAERYPEETAGIVFVDHASQVGVPAGEILPGIEVRSLDGSLITKSSPPGTEGLGPIAFGLSDDSNFSKLSAQDQELHRWFMAKERDQKALQANHEIIPQCFADADAALEKRDHPLGDKPVVDVDTPDSAGAALQNTLRALSRNSKEMVAEKSGHFVIIDRPDVVIDAIQQVVQSVRDKRPL
jgi:pimeloyl-ACP methyl ester carboxylesterase